MDSHLQKKKLNTLNSSIALCIYNYNFYKKKRIFNKNKKENKLFSNNKHKTESGEEFVFSRTLKNIFKTKKRYLTVPRLSI